MTQDPLNALPGSAGSPERGRETSGPFGDKTTTNGTPAKDAATIRGMFAAIAPRYDLLNHLLSGGLDLYWRRATVEALLAGLARAPRTNGQSAPPSSGAAGARRVLDLCAEPASVADVSKGLFGAIQGYNVLLALEETGAHVEYLYNTGELVAGNVAELREQEEPVIEYIRA